MFSYLLIDKIGIWTIVPEKNCHPIRVRVRARVRVSLRVGGQFFLGAIVLEPKKYVLEAVLKAAVLKTL